MPSPVHLHMSSCACKILPFPAHEHEHAHFSPLSCIADVEAEGLKPEQDDLMDQRLAHAPADHAHVKQMFWIATWRQAVCSCACAGAYANLHTHKSLIFLHMHTFPPRSRRGEMEAEGLMPELDDLMLQLERHYNRRLPEGYNPNLRFMSHLWEPLRHIYRCWAHGTFRDGPCMGCSLFCMGCLGSAAAFAVVSCSIHGMLGRTTVLRVQCVLAAWDFQAWALHGPCCSICCLVMQECRVCWGAQLQVLVLCLFV
mgnify:CR=1 FL=1